MESLIVNGVEYIKKIAVSNKMFIVRGDRSGVFFGEIESRDGREVKMKNARRLWQWFGAASLSQLAMEGVKLPEKCKFPTPMAEVLLLDAIEIINCSHEAIRSINEVPIWKQ